MCSSDLTILKDTHPQIKFDVFERLNTGSIKLNPQELRHGINFGYLMEQIDTLTKFDKWQKAVGIKSDKRMKSGELILRYFAFRHNRTKYSKPLSSFLGCVDKVAQPQSDRNEVHKSGEGLGELFISRCEAA